MNSHRKPDLLIDDLLLIKASGAVGRKQSSFWSQDLFAISLTNASSYRTNMQRQSLEMKV